MREFDEALYYKVLYLTEGTERSQPEFDFLRAGAIRIGLDT